jgi:octaheme c-type cytochrome (tetrathionate reductase family)
LICHDTTGSYKKFPTDCGHPAYEEKKFGEKIFKPVDLTEVAQKVGKPTRNNCGTCHFFGGGDDGVKHGDLDSSMFKPDKALDVHMDSEGLNYACTKCHTTINHQISGRIYTQPAPAVRESALLHECGSRMSCESCHTPQPHKNNNKMNDHTDKVACQTCHIPAFARGGKPTMMGWDWSTAGQKQPDGKPVVKKDALEKVAYHTMKGDMVWAKDVVPDLFWYNGKMDFYRFGEAFDDTRPLELNTVQGHYKDPDSRISPFKIFRGKQIYDKTNKTLVYTKLFGPKGSGAYWSDYDWNNACEVGMKEHPQVPYSGDIGFVETAMYWPISHMIAPKEQSLSCEACHSGEGLLKNLTGFYVPGRDCCKFLDIAGWGIVILTCVLVLLHNFGLCCRKKGESK